MTPRNAASETEGFARQVRDLRMRSRDAASETEGFVS